MPDETLSQIHYIAHLYNSILSTRRKSGLFGKATQLLKGKGESAASGIWIDLHISGNMRSHLL